MGTVKLVGKVETANRVAALAVSDDNRKTFKSLAFRHDGTQLAGLGTERNTVHVWEVATGKEVKRLAGHTAPIFSVAVSAESPTAP